MDRPNGVSGPTGQPPSVPQFSFAASSSRARHARQVQVSSGSKSPNSDSFKKSELAGTTEGFGRAIEDERLGYETP